MNKSWTIRTQLSALLLVTLAPLVLFLAYNVYQQRQAARENALHDTLAHARIIANRVDHELESIDSVLLAASALLTPDLSSVEDNDRRLRDLHSSLPGHTGSIWVMTPDGKTLNATLIPPEKRAGFNFADRGYFRKALVQKKTVFDRPIISRVSGKPILVAARPIIASDGSVSAIVALSTELEQFQAFLASGTLHHHSLMTLLDDQGTMLARSVNPKKWVGTNIGERENFRRVIALREYSTETISADGIKRLSGFVTTRRLGWVVYVGIPTEAALAQSTADIRRLLAVALFACMAALLLALFFARRITRPIDDIAEGARQIAAGKTDVRIKSTGTTEITEVAGQFNQMVDSLHHAHHLLAGQKDILAGVASGRPLADSLDAICRLAEEDDDEMLCSILLLDSDGVHLRHGAAPSLHPEYMRQIDDSAIGPAAGSCGTAAFRGQPVVVEDITTDPLWAEYRHLATPYGLRSCWSTPVFDDKKLVLGTFAIYYRQPRLPSPQHMHLIEICTQTAAVALQHHRATSNLAKSEERFMLASLAANDAIWDWDFEKSTVWWNDGFTSLFGYPPEEVEPGPESWTNRIHPDDVSRVTEDIHAVIDGSAQLWSAEYRFRRHDGEYAEIFDRGFVIRDSSGKATRMIGAMQDITRRKQAEEKVKRLNRVHTVLSGINTLIVRERNKQKLFDEACRIAAEDGGFTRVWIGKFDPSTLDVTPVAWAGFGIDEEWARMKATGRDDPPYGQGAVGRAIRSRKPVFVNDMTLETSVNNERRRSSLAQGLRSTITLPLFVDDEIVATFSLYTREPGFFDAEEVRLLTELAGDISFALQYLEKSEKADYLAYYDVVTGLPNRTLCMEHLTQALHSSSGKLALVLGDIQRFRMINETLGRQAGDAVLKQVAAHLLQFVQTPENLARVSADGFATFLPEIRSVAEVVHRIENLAAKALHTPVRIDGKELTLSFTVGVAVYPDDGADAETLFHNAEAALRKAKATGERYLFYAPEINARVAEALTLENKLRQALELDQFVLFYQPKVDVRTRALTGMEALIRWQDPELGLVPPIKFISLLEETGLIVDVGAWALRRAVADSRNWIAQGLHPPRIAVNVSAIQLRRDDFVDTIIQTLDGFGDADNALDLEITESIVMENVQDIIRKLQVIRGLGINIAIDDFGTGYSSLSYIAKLPISTLKIDRSFIIEMSRNDYSRDIVTMIIQLAHTLRLNVVAEGVDDESHVTILGALGCDQMQGYLIRKPLPPDEIAPLLKSPGARII